MMVKLPILLKLMLLLYQTGSNGTEKCGNDGTIKTSN